MAEGVTVANAYVQIMPSAKDAKESITEAILPAAESAGSEAGELLGGGLLDKVKGIAGPLAGAIGAAVGAIGALGVGKMLVDVGSEFDDMTDAIILGTGASGDALDELTGIAKDVATTVPVSFGDAGEYVAELSTRLGLAGDDLQSVATQVGALDSMLGGVNVESLSGAFAAWGVSAEDMSSEMDYLFSVSQNTGIGFDDLTGIVEKNAPAMQALGFSFEDTANMAGLLDQAGMDASGMMGKMNKALVELAGEGGDASVAFEDVLTQMEGFIESGDEASALDLATTLFGTKGAAQFMGAVESGALSIDDLKDSALGAGEGIMGTFEATADWAEKWELLKNKAKEALEPLAGFAFDALGAGIDMLTQAFDALLPAVQPLIDTLGAILVDTVMPAAQAAFDTFFPIVTELGTAFLDVATVVVGAVQGLLDAASPILDSILQTVSNVFEGVKTTVEGVVKFVTSLVEGDFEGMADAVDQIFEGVKSTADSIWNGIKDVIGAVVDAISSTVSNVFDGVKSTASNIWEGIKEAIQGPIESARDIVSNAIDAIKGFFSFEISWPHIPLPHFYVSGSANPLDWLTQGVPSIGIDWYAKGGIVEDATLIGAGEKGAEMVWPSYEPYLSKYAAAIAENMPRGGGVDIHDCTFIVRKESDIDRVANQLNTFINRQTAGSLA